MNRVRILIDQSRYDLAERELRHELAANPENANAHSLLALCLLKSKSYKEATEEVQESLRIVPDYSYAHYVLAIILRDCRRPSEAKQTIDEALRLDPTNADYFALLSSILLEQGNHGGALEAAEKGLQFDAEHADCTNLRALVLIHLGRKAEAGTALQAALARDPENAVTHASRGWSLLHMADYAEALQHFRESLRLDPDSEWAREGIIEALKAQHLVYGLILRYFLWISGRGSWFLGVLAFVGIAGCRLSIAAGRVSPTLGLLILPIVVISGLFLYLRIMAVPFFNLLLRLDKFGRLTLSPDEITASNWVGGCIVGAVAVGATGLIVRQGFLNVGGVVLGLLVLPIAFVFQCRPGWRRRAMVAYTAVAGLAGLLSSLLALVAPHSDLGPGLFAVPVLAAFLAPFVASYLIDKLK